MTIKSRLTTIGQYLADQEPHHEYKIVYSQQERETWEAEQGRRTAEGIKPSIRIIHIQATDMSKPYEHQKKGE